MNNNDEILKSLERVVAELKRKKSEVATSQFAERNEQMRRLRLEEHWSLQRIGDKYGISRERVRQIVGNTGWIKERSEYVRSQVDKTNGELAAELGIHYCTISQIRGDIRHAVISDSLVGIGHEWENWASQYLTENKIFNELQPIKSPYDIIALDNVYIDVKVATKPAKTSPKLISQQWHFRPNTRHDKADLYMLIIAPTEDVFIVPNEVIGDKPDLHFCWPTKRPTMSKMAKYHNRLDLIWKVHNDKTKEA